MTDTERAFLLAAAADPADDSLRLVYSDWLEEQPGEAMTAHAEFVRLQVTRAKIIRESPGDLVVPTRREQELAQKFQRNWNGRIHRLLNDLGSSLRVDTRSGGIRGWSYCRGMIGSLTVSGRALSEVLPLVRHLGPVRRLVISGDPHPTHQVNIIDLLSRYGRQLHVVEFRGDTLWDQALDAMGSVPVLDLRRVGSLHVTASRVMAAYRAQPWYQAVSRGVTLYTRSIPPHTEVRSVDHHDLWKHHRAEFVELTGYTHEPLRHHGAIL